MGATQSHNIRFFANQEQAVQVSKSSPTFPATTEEVDKLYSKLEIELKGVDPAVLKSFTTFTTTAANHLGIEVGKK